jgi:hypothetical protein
LSCGNASSKSREPGAGDEQDAPLASESRGDARGVLAQGGLVHGRSYYDHMPCVLHCALENGRSDLLGLRLQGGEMSDASAARAHDLAAESRAGSLARGVDSHADVIWLGLGFGLFGSVLGAIAGASSVQGISQTLLTSVLTFVGGAFLSYAGFRVRPHAGEAPSVSGVRVGASLAAISLGIWLGAGVGIYARLRFDAAERARLGAAQPAAAAPRNLLQADQGRTFCQETRQRLADPDYRQTPIGVLLGELRGVVEECCGR